MPPIKIGRIRTALDEGKGIRETAPLLKVSAAKVSEVYRYLPGDRMARRQVSA